MGYNNAEDYFLGNMDFSKDRNKSKENKIPKNLIEDTEKVKSMSKVISTFSGEEADMDDYIGVEKENGEVFSEKEIKQDRAESSFEYKYFNQKINNSEKYSDLFEKSWSAAVNMGFFGENTRALKTSQYDDHRGIDFVFITKNLEDPKNGEESYFGVDLTYSARKVKSKIDGIKLMINGRRKRIGDTRKKRFDYQSLYDVKYFTDKDGKYKRIKVAKVIHGADQGSSEEFIKEVISEDKNKVLYSLTKLKTVMVSMWQAKYFFELAKKKKKSSTAIAYRDLYNFYWEIYNKDRGIYSGNKNDITKDFVVAACIKELDIDGEDMFDLEKIEASNNSLGYVDFGKKPDN